MYTQAQFDKMFAELPDDVKDAMTAVDTVNILLDIKERYNLHIDQAGELSAEVGMLMLGMTPPQRFLSRVETELRIPPEVARKISEEVNEKIFRPVRRSLMEIHKMKEAEEERENETLEAGNKTEKKETASDHTAATPEVPSAPKPPAVEEKIIPYKEIEKQIEKKDEKHEWAVKPAGVPVADAPKTPEVPKKSLEERKDILEQKLKKPFSVPLKTSDPYRETV